MLIDNKHKPWMIATLVLAAGATAWYVIDAPRHMNQMYGSTAAGLTFGIAGYAIMWFCAALGMKRRVPHWKLGRAQTWLRGHIWLGLLLVVLVAYHSGFQAVGPQGWSLWIVLGLVTASGLMGLFIQQTVPRILYHGLHPLQSMNAESPAQQIKELIADCAAEAEKTVIHYAGSLDKPAPDMPIVTAIAAPHAPAPPATPAPAPSPHAPSAAAVTAAAATPVVPGAAVAVAAPPAAPAATPPAPPAAAPKPAVPLTIKIGPPMGGEPVRRFYLDAGSAFWSGKGRTALDNESSAASVFAMLRTATPPHIHAGIDDLEELAARRRQLLVQRRWMKLLHGWLIVHVPLSWGFIVFVAVHAFQSLRYWGLKV
ncbi:MAG: hypothetical protein ACKVS8_09285 [Phycisphaerales bacterium]